MAKTTTLAFTMATDLAGAQQSATTALEHHKFTLTWADPFNATAERGNKFANMILGALAQYFKIGVRIGPGDGGYTLLCLDRQSSGWMGGAVGARRTQKNMEALRDGLTEWLGQQNLLVSVSET